MQKVQNTKVVNPVMISQVQHIDEIDKDPSDRAQGDEKKMSSEFKQRTEKEPNQIAERITKSKNDDGRRHSEDRIRVNRVSRRTIVEDIEEGIR